MTVMTGTELVWMPVVERIQRIEGTIELKVLEMEDEERIKAQLEAWREERTAKP